jgi:signal transduction histidine kinase
VVDSGAGIPSEALSRVMDAFFTTKGTGHTGLGLATVRGVVEGAGGGVEIESEVGVGTSVRIAVPRVGGMGRGGG